MEEESIELAMGSEIESDTGCLVEQLVELDIAVKIWYDPANLRFVEVMLIFTH